MIDLTDLKAHLGADAEVDENADAVLTDLEERAVDFVERETGRHFGASTEFVEYLDGTGTNTLWLLHEPLGAPTVEERAEVGDAWEAVATGDDDGWESRGERLLRKAGYKWTLGYEYRVTYDAGYTAGEEPGEIRQLVIDMVAYRWRQRGIEGHASGSIGDYSFSRTITRPWSPSEMYSIPGAQEVLERWRRVQVA